MAGVSPLRAGRSCVRGPVMVARIMRALYATVLPLLAVSAIGGCAQLPGLAVEATAPGPAPEVTADGGRLHAEVARFAVLADEYRRLNGCDALVWNPAVARIAQAHSEDMSARGFFDHRDPDGRMHGDRLLASGIRYRRAGENIAQGQTYARQVLQGWVSSPTHRETLEDCRYTHHGVGFNGRNWTHVLMTP
jgi:uncharacterized protein YkwD